MPPRNQFLKKSLVLNGWKLLHAKILACSSSFQPSLKFSQVIGICIVSKGRCWVLTFWLIYTGVFLSYLANFNSFKKHCHVKFLTSIGNMPLLQQCCVHVKSSGISVNSSLIQSKLWNSSAATCLHQPACPAIHVHLLLIFYQCPGVSRRRLMCLFHGGMHNTF